MNAFDRLMRRMISDVLLTQTAFYMATLHQRQMRSTTALTPVEFTRGKGTKRNMQSQAKCFRGNEKGKAF